MKMLQKVMFTAVCAVVGFSGIRAADAPSEAPGAYVGDAKVPKDLIVCGLSFDAADPSCKEEYALAFRDDCFSWLSRPFDSEMSAVEKRVTLFFSWHFFKLINTFKDSENSSFFSANTDQLLTFFLDFTRLLDSMTDEEAEQIRHMTSKEVGSMSSVAFAMVTERTVRENLEFCWHVVYGKFLCDQVASLTPEVIKAKMDVGYMGHAMTMTLITLQTKLRESAKSNQSQIEKVTSRELQAKHGAAAAWQQKRAEAFSCLLKEVEAKHAALDADHR